MLITENKSSINENRLIIFQFFNDNKRLDKWKALSNVLCVSCKSKIKLISGTLTAHQPNCSKHLPQVKRFRYLWVLFMSEDRMQREINRWIGAASAVMRILKRTVMKRELSLMTKLLFYWSIFILTHGHELSVKWDRGYQRLKWFSQQGVRTHP